MYSFARRWLGLALTFVVASCSTVRRDATRVRADQTEASTTAQAPASAPPQPDAGATASPARAGLAYVTPYPRASWRFAGWEELQRVVLWSSHILIRHADAPTDVPFNLAYWFSLPDAPARSRAQALALARQIAAQAQTPEEFAELARQYSEDITSSDDAGYVGGLSAADLSAWPQVLDAFAALRVGEVSQVVETEYGFHVLLRSAPPLEQALSGEHIVIGHERAQWLQVLARGELPERTREQALALAMDIYEQARRAPEHFAELVASYSEHRDALVTGDFGRWSTRENNPFPGRMKRLIGLAVGEVAPPVETHLGFEIVRRAAPRPRRQYRASVISLSFDPEAAPADESFRDGVLTRAVSRAKELARNPSRFAQLSSEAPIETQWEEGRGIPALTLALDKLEQGAIAAKPIQAEFRFLIARREAPEPVANVSYMTELPAPAQPDLDAFFAARPAEDARAALRTALERTQANLQLSDEQRAGLVEVRVHALEGAFSSQNTPEQQQAEFHALLDAVRARLSPALYSEYLAIVNAVVASALLSAPAGSVPEGR